MKKIILSFDYELFFGDLSGTVQKSLIAPTNALMDQMEAVGFRGNFFVDWLMIKYLRMQNDDRCKDDLQLVTNQLQDMIRRGHRVELHLHPHWMDAKYNGDGTWNFSDFTHYSLNSLSDAEIESLFVEGVNCLKEIISPVCNDYRIIAFRAGGWAIQPFNNKTSAFLSSGICIDSTVAKGCFLEKDNSFFDFRNVPNKSFYRFKSDVCVETFDHGDFIEVPISTYYRDAFTSFLSCLSNLVTKKHRRQTDGSHKRSGDKGHTKLSVFERRKRACMFNLDVLPFRNEIKILLSNRDLLCFLSHPKDINGYTLSNISRLSKYGISVSYLDMFNNKSSVC